MMKNLMTAYFANAAKRAQYRQMRDEIASLSRREALDLGIYPEDASKIAAQAVWG
jgi:uncharacterized protein YjiS (DUF1127 family)